MNPIGNYRPNIPEGTENSSVDLSGGERRSAIEHLISAILPQIVLGRYNQTIIAHSSPNGHIISRIRQPQQPIIKIIIRQPYYY